ncbi:hypothetical protein ACFSRY_15150 [Pontibacter locisalis]|uniref:Uncharacterized protein n=1 Tax=Pontibacter locisalis TaxID=1719035 RepID=A0ABW5IR38_9BACT
MLSSLLRHFHNRTPWFTANFDSCSALAKALGNYLHGHAFAGVGETPNSELLAEVINLMPWELQKSVYVKGSSKEAVSPDKLGEVNAEEFSEWVTGLYPAKKYPVILIGSSNGAAVHMAAAMGIPWLPQTFMIPVEAPDHLSVDDPIERMEWAVEPARQLLSANPDLQLHHMMDPNQDRPMLNAISYFRVKRLQLGAAYEEFITNNLEKGSTLLLLDCRKSWPITKVDTRHYFQFGGLGGITPEGYHQGSEEISEFLRRNESDVEKWTAPKPDGTGPESEWGFEPTLGEDITRFAQENGYQVQRIVYEEPEDLSPFVADLYHWWYEQRSMAAKTLIADMFFLLEPYWTIRTGSVPFWLAFNSKSSVNRLKEYLRKTAPYENVYILPFSNGVKAVGLATLEDMKSALSYARNTGDFIGFDPSLYPFDFGIYARYQKEMEERLPLRYDMEPSLTLVQLLAFADQTKSEYQVKIVS